MRAMGRLGVQEGDRSVPCHLGVASIYWFYDFPDLLVVSLAINRGGDSVHFSFRYTVIKLMISELSAGNVGSWWSLALMMSRSAMCSRIDLGRYSSL